MRTILFICTGNTCRSPMAEAMARRLLDEGRVEGAGADVFVASAGVAAEDGFPISEETVDALSRRGIEHQGTSKRLTPEMIRKASVVVGMTRSHVEEAARLLRQAAPADRSGSDGGSRPGSGGPRLERLDPEHDLEDPVGRGQAAYDRLADRLGRLLPERLAEFLRP